MHQFISDIFKIWFTILAVGACVIIVQEAEHPGSVPLIYCKSHKWRPSKFHKNMNQYAIHDALNKQFDELWCYIIMTFWALVRRAPESAFRRYQPCGHILNRRSEGHYTAHIVIFKPEILNFSDCKFSMESWQEVLFLCNALLAYCLWKWSLGLYMTSFGS